MSRIEEIEQAVERLPVPDFVRLAALVDRRRRSLEISRSPADEHRDHSAFLNSYTPEDEGLYDDAGAR